MLPLTNIENGTYWDTQSVHEHLTNQGSVENVRATERLLEKAAWLPRPTKWSEVGDELGRPIVQLVGSSLEEEAKRKRHSLFVVQYVETEEARCLMVNDGRMGRRWRFVDGPMDVERLEVELEKLCTGKSAIVFPTGEITALCRSLVRKHDGHQIPLGNGDTLTLALTAYRDNEVFASYPERFTASTDELTHLDRLEAESIHIMREVAAQAENPVMLYSVGKDSSVMLHLARKAFYPSPPPFPLMHVDTRWKFQAMYEFRDKMAEEVGMDLIVHINPEGIAKDINPFDHGSALHTDVMKTQGLKQALDQHGFDVAFGGARRDEEKSRAKERVFSFRSSSHRWDPKSQRPELWNLYNGYKSQGESIRVFPLSNWTELDIWQYIYREHIPIVPLYFSAERPVVEREGMLMMVDDDRMRLLPGESIETRRIRFRTLGCYPLTGAIDSEADSLSSIVLELLQSRTSERQGRAIDSDSSGSMEKKKQEGYF
ncbi:MAG: sulfate adenylyltransferase subunit CysD [Pseudomonadales bacterium]|nr:sulfate adenylyltransferase subunit CysD [Pseudomonadales bacterium]